MYGLGLRSPHHEFVLKNQPKVDFFEVHTENFISEGGESLRFLENICEIYPISFHCVGMSLGSYKGLDMKHLKDIKNLCDRFNPILLSDHLSWSASEKGVSNDLLPAIYNKESLQIFVDNIKKAQDFFGRQILIENPSAYLEFEQNDFSEVDFFNLVVENSQCAILLDINNIFVSCHNFKLNASKYLKQINLSKVEQVHLAGHSSYNFNGNQILIDTHSATVCDEVFDLYKEFLGLIKNKSIPNDGRMGRRYS